MAWKASPSSFVEAGSTHRISVEARGLQPMGNPRNFFEPNWKRLSTPPNFKKNALVFLKVALLLKPKLIAPHLQIPNSRVYVHFHLVNKQLTKFLVQSETVHNVCS